MHSILEVAVCTDDRVCGRRITGRVRRRRWSDEVKSRIVAESYGPGAIASEVARRHDPCSQQLSAWRKAVRDGLL
jgi:transposase